MKKNVKRVVSVFSALLMIILSTPFANFAGPGVFPEAKAGSRPARSDT